MLIKGQWKPVRSNLALLWQKKIQCGQERWNWRNGNRLKRLKLYFAYLEMKFCHFPGSKMKDFRVRLPGSTPALFTLPQLFAHKQLLSLYFLTKCQQ